MSPLEEDLLILGLGGTMGANSKSLMALQRALRAAEDVGAMTDVLPVDELDLPIFQPETTLADYGANVEHLIESVRRADGLILSTAGYHGTLAGITKNALDYLQFLADDGYLGNRPVGLIATSGGYMAGVNAVNAMIHAVHALRGVVVPLSVSIPQAWKVFSAKGEIRDAKWDDRLEKLGRLTVELAGKLRIIP